MTSETLTGFAALASLGFGLLLALLMLFMALVQPIWSVVDCAIDRQRGTQGKVLWIIGLILLWGVANWFYGAFAASNRLLLRLTRLAWALLIGLVVAFVVICTMNADFRRGIEKEWHDRVQVVQLAPPVAGRLCCGWCGACPRATCGSRPGGPRGCVRSRPPSSSCTQVACARTA